MKNAARTVDGLRRITIMQGETKVSDDPEAVLTTVLGSCISACLFDPVVKVGGLNHFLLAEPGTNDTDVSSLQRYGVYAMEVLINAMLAMGQSKPWPDALQVFTGSREMSGKALIDYFAPLKTWLDEQNRGKPQGW